MLFVFFVYYCLPPFLIGVVIKWVARKREVPGYLVVVFSASLFFVLYLINGRSPMLVFENKFIGFLLFTGIYTIFIKAGIESVAEFIKGYKGLT